MFFSTFFFQVCFFPVPDEEQGQGCALLPAALLPM